MNAMCDLCRLEKRTEWYFEDPDFVIIECDTCHVPMAVWRNHMEAPGHKEEYALQCLKVVADRVFGAGNWVTDRENKKIADHWHVHARKK